MQEKPKQDKKKKDILILPVMMSIMATDALNSSEEMVQELMMECKGSSGHLSLHFQSVQLISRVWKQRNY